MSVRLRNLIRGGLGPIGLLRRGRRRRRRRRRREHLVVEVRKILKVLLKKSCVKAHIELIWL
jgi:hypothetical protein